jgi:protein-disulfide isomerase
MSKGSAIISILIAFVGGLLIGNLTGGPGGGEEGDEIAGAGSAEGDARGAAAAGDVERFDVPVTDEQPSKGADDALVTIVEVSDFECPFCSRVGPTLEQVMREYEGKVRIVWLNQPLPMHRNAPMAHNAAMEVFDQAGDEKFWQYHDKLFENQRELTRPNLEQWAQEIGGVDMAQFRAALDNNEHQAKIAAEQAVAAAAGARGTPHFFINGRRIAGAQPFEQFKTIIDDEIQRAEQMIEAGVDRNAIYASFMRAARENAPAAAAGAAEGAQPEQPQPQPDPSAVYRVPVSDNMPQKGPDNALVTIVEVSDFECPFCGRVNPTIAQILEQYGNDVRIMWANNPLPFHQNAPAAHNAALEVFQQGGDAKFWAFHDILFQNQRALTREDLERYAQQVGGINMAQFRQALETNEHQAIIQEHQTLARQLGASGTPSFFINGRNLRGAQPFDAFKAVIDEELAKARAKVAAGTPRARVYEETIRDGATSQQMINAPAAAAQPQLPAEPPADQVYEISVPNDVPRKGPRNAPVVIQEFSDFECPFCSRVNPTIQQILQEYPRQVQIVWRHYPLPFHQNAPLAHQASMEVHRQGGDDKFWAYHDILFQNQRALARADLERYAQQVGGIDMAQFRQALETNRHQARMQQDMTAVQEAGARIGTPSFFINGRLIQGAQPFDAFKTAIDRALAER